MWWVKIQRHFKDPRKLRNLAKKPETKYWLLIIIFLVLVYLLLSNGDFSFFLTLCSTLQMISFIGIILQVRHNTSGLSFYTFAFYSVIYFSRLSSILLYENYLPYDTSGDWFYQTVEIASFALSVWIATKLKNTKEPISKLLYAIPCVILALFSHTTLNRLFITDYLWTLSMYMEAVALVPLVEEMTKVEDLDNFSTHFVAARTVSQILSSIFWIKSYHELNNVYGATKINLFPTWSGYFVLGSQIISCFFTGKFFIQYVKSAALGTPFILPM